MAIQNFDPGTSFGQQLGSSLGRALSMLAEQKIQDTLNERDVKRRAQVQQEHEQRQNQYQIEQEQRKLQASSMQAQRLEDMYVQEGMPRNQAAILARNEAAQAPYWKARIAQPGNQAFVNQLSNISGVPIPGAGQGGISALSGLAGSPGTESPGMVSPEGVQGMPMGQPGASGMGAGGMPQSMGPFGLQPTISPDQATKLADIGLKAKDIERQEAWRNKNFNESQREAAVKSAQPQIDQIVAKGRAAP